MLSLPWGAQSWLDFFFLLGRVVLDIAVVAWFVYRLLRLIRGTRAMELLKGIAFVFLIFFFSQALKLETLRVVLSKLSQVGLVAIAVVFQPELRRALEQLGQAGFMGWLDQIKGTVDGRSVRLVAEAAYQMSDKRVGALIVIERQTGLNDYVETGIAVNARISSELLRTVFEPTTPLHDGAAILRADKIVAVGCYLPLSEGLHLGKTLGTRHRAAVGLSEISDAVVVIVSEETGFVSLATAGKLERCLDEERLRTRLYGLLVDGRRDRFSFLRYKLRRRDALEMTEKIPKTVDSQGKDELKHRSIGSIVSKFFSWARIWRKKSDDKEMDDSGDRGKQVHLGHEGKKVDFILKDKRDKGEFMDSRQEKKDEDLDNRQKDHRN